MGRRSRSSLQSPRQFGSLPGHSLCWNSRNSCHPAATSVALEILGRRPLARLSLGPPRGFAARYRPEFRDPPSPGARPSLRVVRRIVLPSPPGFCPARVPAFPRSVKQIWTAGCRWSEPKHASVAIALVKGTPSMLSLGSVVRQLG